MTEQEFKAGLLKLNPNFTFDVGGRAGGWHPFIGTRQSVYLTQPNGTVRHVCAMERGAAIPEFNVWGVVTDTQTGSKRKSHVVKVGWRHSLQVMVDRKVPGITWENLYRVFNIQKKDFVGTPDMLDVARM